MHAVAEEAGFNMQLGAQWQLQKCAFFSQGSGNKWRSFPLDCSFKLFSFNSLVALNNLDDFKFSRSRKKLKSPLFVPGILHPWCPRPPDLVFTPHLKTMKIPKLQSTSIIVIFFEEKQFFTSWCELWQSFVFCKPQKLHLSEPSRGKILNSAKIYRSICQWMKMNCW